MLKALEERRLLIVGDHARSVALGIAEAMSDEKDPEQSPITKTMRDALAAIGAPGAKPAKPADPDFEADWTYARRDLEE